MGRPLLNVSDIDPILDDVTILMLRWRWAPIEVESCGIRCKSIDIQGGTGRHIWWKL
jgi:hypothetical protein